MLVNGVMYCVGVQAMLALVTGPAAAIMDPAVLLAALQALKLWILDPACSQGTARYHDGPASTLCYFWAVQIAVQAMS